MTIDPTLYWKLRTLTLEAERAADRFRTADAARLACLVEILTPHGLEPRGAYKLVDETCEITQVE